MPRKRVVRVLLTLLALGPLAQAASGQALAPAERPLADRLSAFALSNLPLGPTRGLAIDSLADVLGTNPYGLAYYAIPRKVLADDFRRFLQTAERGRVDQQIGTETAATRTGLSTLLGFALQSGAVTQTIEQQVGTLRANADGLLRFLSNQEVIPTCETDRACQPAGFLKDVELAASFSLGEAGTKTIDGTTLAGEPVTFEAPIDTQQLTSFAVRYAARNTRDVRSPEYRKRWAEWMLQNRSALNAPATALLNAMVAVANKIKTVNAAGGVVGAAESSQYALWLTATAAKLKAAATNEALQVALSEQLDDLLTKMRALDPDVEQKLADFGEAYLRYIAVRRDVTQALVTDPAMTLDYTYSTPALTPKYHSVKVAWAFSPGNDNGTPERLPGTPGFRPKVANPGTITLNASLDYFHDLQPAGVGEAPSHWKSALLAVQFDRPLGPGDGPSRLSVGGYYQYQFADSVIVVPENARFLSGTSIPLSDAGRQVLGKKGSIFAAQALLTLRLGNSGLLVPLGVSWSNKTELVNGNEVRGHIGFSFDTTPLLLMSGLR